MSLRYFTILSSILEYLLKNKKSLITSPLPIVIHLNWRTPLPGVILFTKTHAISIGSISKILTASVMILMRLIFISQVWHNSISVPSVGRTLDLIFRSFISVTSSKVHFAHTSSLPRVLSPRVNFQRIPCSHRPGINQEAHS